MRPATGLDIAGLVAVRPRVLVVPIAHKPGAVADSAPPVSDGKDAMLMRLLGSDFLF